MKQHKIWIKNIILLLLVVLAIFLIHKIRTINFGNGIVHETLHVSYR